MKKLLLILLFPVISYSQTDTCFTTDEILDISFTLDSLYELDSLNKLIIERQDKLIGQLKTTVRLDSLEMAYRTKQVDLLKTNVDLYIEREKYLKPRWYDHKAIWFTAGILTSVFTTKLVIELTK